jgi:hypothetical protein
MHEVAEDTLTRDFGSYIFLIMGKYETEVNKIEYKSIDIYEVTYILTLPIDKI